MHTLVCVNHISSLRFVGETDASGFMNLLLTGDLLYLVYAKVCFERGEEEEED